MSGAPELLLENQLAPLSLRGWFSYQVMKLFVAFIARAPRPIFYLTVSLLTWLVYYLDRGGRKRILSNVRFIYGQPPHAKFSKDFVKQCYRHQVTSALETLRYSQKPDDFVVHGLEDLQKNFKRAEGKGIVAVTAHLGSWELLAAVSPPVCPVGFYGLAKPSRNSGASRILNEIRQFSGTRILWTGQSSLAKDMFKVLKGGHVLGMVMDQKPKGRVGPEVDFMGKITPFVSGPATMAERTGACHMSFFCVREGPMRYRVLSSFLNPASESGVFEYTQLYASEIEKAVRMYPEQWLWNYKRWNYEELGASLKTGF